MLEAEMDKERSIPACAGEANGTPLNRRQVWVYPRVCGGSFIRLGVIELWAGLSPRVRGKLQHEDDPRQTPGSIPACAGEA